jgi:hypothetical protein
MRALSQENRSHQFPWIADAIAKKTITLSDTPVCLCHLRYNTPR